MTEADDMREWKRKQLSMNASPPKLPEGVEVSPRVQDLYDNLAAQADALPPGDDRLDVLEAMAGLGDKVKAQAGAIEPAFIEHRFNTKTSFTDPKGRPAVHETDPRGNVRTTTNAILKDGQVVPIDPEQAAEAEATQRRWIDERADIREDRVRARRMGELAEELDDASLRDQATAIRASADERTAKLKEEIPHDLWQSFELGPYDLVKAAVTPAVEALAAGKFDEAHAAFDGMNPEERMKFWDEAMGLRDGAQRLDAMTQRVEDQEVKDEASRS